MKDNRTAEQIQADTLRVLNRDAELRAEKTPAPPREAQQALPKRDVKALVEALRIRALALTGQEWERTATRDMMKEAAQMLEDMEAALHASEAGPREQSWATSRQELVDRYLSEVNAIPDGDSYSLSDLLKDFEALIRRDLKAEAGPTQPLCEIIPTKDEWLRQQIAEGGPPDSLETMRAAHDRAEAGPRVNKDKILSEFDFSVAGVHLLDGPRPDYSNYDTAEWHTRGISQGLKIARTILEEVLMLDCSSAAGPQAPREEPGPIALNPEQQEAATLWAADDRLWTTQEVVEFNLKVFARKILGLEAGVSARVPEEPHA